MTELREIAANHWQLCDRFERYEALLRSIIETAAQMASHHANVGGYAAIFLHFPLQLILVEGGA